MQRSSSSPRIKKQYVIFSLLVLGILVGLHQAVWRPSRSGIGLAKIPYKQAEAEAAASAHKGELEHLKKAHEEADVVSSMYEGAIEKASAENSGKEGDPKNTIEVLSTETTASAPPTQSQIAQQPPKPGAELVRVQLKKDHLSDNGIAATLTQPERKSKWGKWTRRDFEQAVLEKPWLAGKDSDQGSLAAVIARRKCIVWIPTVEGLGAQLAALMRVMSMFPDENICFPHHITKHYGPTLFPCNADYFRAKSGQQLYCLDATPDEIINAVKCGLVASPWTSFYNGSIPPRDPNRFRWFEVPEKWAIFSQNSSMLDLFPKRSDERCVITKGCDPRYRHRFFRQCHSRPGSLAFTPR